MPADSARWSLRYVSDAATARYPSRFETEEATMSNSEEREREALTSVVDDLAEMGGKLIEILKGSKALEYVPYAKWGVSVFRVVKSVGDKMLDNKIKAFVQETGRCLSAWEVADTISRLEHNRHYAETVGEHLIEHLDRLEGRRKAFMSAAVFAAFAKKGISEEIFYRLTRAIEVVQLRELPALRNLIEEGPYILRPGPSSRKMTPDVESLELLSAANLTRSRTAATLGASSISWHLTDTGTQFLDLRLDLILCEER
jgi:hypothetical protein